MASYQELERLLAAGRYFEAFGLPRGSTRMEIDKAAAVLGEAYPHLAGSFGCLAEVLADPDRREVYELCCGFRDDVLATLEQRYGTQFLDTYQDLEQRIWTECQRLLRCEFRRNLMKMGPWGTQSLLQAGSEWVISGVLNGCLPVLVTDEYDRASGSAQFGLADTCCDRCQTTHFMDCPECDASGLVEDPDSEVVDLADWPGEGDEDRLTVCPTCDGEGYVPCDCSDRYEFEIARQAEPGEVIMGCGLRTGRVTFGLLDQPQQIRRPNHALYVLYTMQQMGYDVALEDAARSAWTAPCVGTGLTMLGGVLYAGCLGSWLTGLALALVVGGMMVLRYVVQFTAVDRLGRAGHLAVALLAPAGLGTLFGHLLSTWELGLKVGLATSACVLLFALAGMKAEQYMH